MSVGGAYRAHEGLAIGYPFSGCCPPVSIVPDVGVMPIDGTLTHGDYPVVCERDAEPGRV